MSAYDALQGAKERAAAQKPKCKRCGDTGTESIPVTHPTNPNLDTWDTRVCSDCRGDLRLAEEISRARDQVVAQRDEAIKRAEVAEEICRLLQSFAYAGGVNDEGEYVTSVLAKCSLLGDLSRIMHREQHMAFECGERT